MTVFLAKSWGTKGRQQSSILLLTIDTTLSTALHCFGSVQQLIHMYLRSYGFFNSYYVSVSLKPDFSILQCTKQHFQVPQEISPEKHLCFDLLV